MHAALAAVSQYLVAYPGDPHAHNLRGLFFHELQIPRPAIEAFAMALKLVSGGPAEEAASSTVARICHMNLANAYSAAGDHAAAAKHYRSASSSVQTRDATILAALGYSLVMQGDVAGGVASYKSALEVLDQGASGRRRAVDISVEAGRVCSAVGQFDVALQILADGNATMGGESPGAALLAQTAVELLKPAQSHDETVHAVENLRKSALSGVISQREYRRLAASLLARAGRADLAVSHISSAVHMYPDSAEDATHLARLVLCEVGSNRDSHNCRACTSACGSLIRLGLQERQTCRQPSLRARSAGGLRRWDESLFCSGSMRMHSVCCSVLFTLCRLAAAVSAMKAAKRWCY